MEVPELFMEFISSMTGKSPSTTGAGSEGALTKGPFNAMPAIVDLNANLLSYVLTGHDGWLSAAGHVGPLVRVDHDFSLLVPELFARMSAHERDARNLIAEGALEKIDDVVHDGAAGAGKPPRLPDDQADGRPSTSAGSSCTPTSCSPPRCCAPSCRTWPCSPSRSRPSR